MMYVEEYNSRQQREREDRIVQAYMTASLYRVKKMPKLDKVLEGARPKEEKRLVPQTPEQQLQAAIRWHKQLTKEG